MPVAVQNEKASDTSRIWLIVSRVAAAVLGGYVVTYWTGAAVAKTAMAVGPLEPGECRDVFRFRTARRLCRSHHLGVRDGVDEKSVVGRGDVDRAARRCHRAHAGTTIGGERGSAIT